ncbi:hypothetical protein EVAR_78894_1 [Eumeta japonica]|uniref:Uncharacterized protein n=1 Tax=Eumeta variegata TaxID=151549 RepID=A0A4C1U329_EUMVA|nr:hypothetical protein EVAR_78894_1 [Eumeta japonica]
MHGHHQPWTLAIPKETPVRCREGMRYLMDEDRVEGRWGGRSGPSEHTLAERNATAEAATSRLNSVRLCQHRTAALSRLAANRQALNQSYQGRYKRKGSSVFACEDFLFILINLTRISGDLRLVILILQLILKRVS